MSLQWSSEFALLLEYLEAKPKTQNYVIRYLLNNSLDLHPVTINQQKKELFGLHNMVTEREAQGKAKIVLLLRL